MKVSSVRIQKFRSIDDATITLDQVMALVGANNVGKSHVLRALNAFFNFSDERESFLNHSHQYSSRSRPRITVVFKDIHPEDLIPEEYLNGGVLTIQFTYRWDRQNPSYEVNLGGEKKPLDIDSFSRLMQHHKYIYVPIIRDYGTSFSRENGIAYQLLSKTIQQQIANRNTIQPHVDRLYDKVRNTVFKTAISRVAGYYPFKKNANFKLDFRDSNLLDNILREVSLELIEDTQTNEIANCGSGVQSAVYFAFSLANEMNSEINYLVGVEEPEQNMHPQAQRQLIESLKNSELYPNTQFLLTTHSPVIIDKLGHTAIALCRKTKNASRDIVTTITQIEPGFWDKYNMQEEKYQGYFLYRNSDFFFSNAMIITESPVDCEIIRCLLSRYGYNAEDLGISFFASDGEKNVRYPYALAHELGIPFICIVDRDTFQPYVGVDRKTSLDDKGIPQYKNELKTSTPLCSVLSPEERFELSELLNNGNFNEAQELLRNKNIYVMKYAIEVDLVTCSSYRHAFGTFLGLGEESCTTEFLLKNMGKRIKSYDVMSHVISTAQTRNLPNSYKFIVQKLREIISNISA